MKTYKILLIILAVLARLFLLDSPSLKISALRMDLIFYTGFNSYLKLFLTLYQSLVQWMTR